MANMQGLISVVTFLALVATAQSCRMQGQSCTQGSSTMNGMGMQGIGIPGMGIPGMGVPGMGMPGIGMPGIGMPGVGTPGMTAQSTKCCTGYCDPMTYKCRL